MVSLLYRTPACGAMLVFLLAGCAGAPSLALPEAAAPASPVADRGVPTGLPSCIQTGNGGRQWWRGPLHYPWPHQADREISQLAPLENLAIADSNLGANQTIVIERSLEPKGPKGGSMASPAQTPPGQIQPSTDSNRIVLDTGSVDWDIDYRLMHLGQILFGLYDVNFYVASGAMRNLPRLEKVTFGSHGGTFTWTLRSAESYRGFENLLADDDLKAAFGVDSGGAIWKALQTADNRPALAQATAQELDVWEHERPVFLTGRPPAPNVAHETCKNI